jgi:two-component system, LytTR family, sensor kinase
MQEDHSVENIPSQNSIGKWLLICAGWIAVVLLFASQWYAYDASRGGSNPFRYYLWWSWYMWAVLTPAVLWFARRRPIDSDTWKWTIPLHVAVSLALTVLQIFVEASIGWARQEHQLSFKGALRHYYSQHIQLSLLTYWAIVGATQFYRMYDQARRRQLHAAQLEARLAESQLEVLRMQLQPHFLFNTLQAATMLIHEDPHGAEDMLLRLSQLLRVSLDELHVAEVSLGREIEFLEQYVGIQQRRFGDRLRFDIRIDQEVLTCAVPSLVLQPLVENAIRHGIGKHKGQDVVTVQCFQSKDKDRLLLEVNNRTGELEDLPKQLSHRGLGLANTKARLEQLYGQQQSLELRNLLPSGVGVILSIPLRRLLPEQGVLTTGVAQ